MALEVDGRYDGFVRQDDVPTLYQPLDLTSDQVSLCYLTLLGLFTSVIDVRLSIRFIKTDSIMSWAEFNPGSQFGSDPHSLEESSPYDRSLAVLLDATPRRGYFALTSCLRCGPGLAMASGQRTP
jgi:hypothetical protein